MIRAMALGLGLLAATPVLAQTTIVNNPFGVCLTVDDIAVNVGFRLSQDTVNKLLTPQAKDAGVRIYVDRPAAEAGIMVLQYWLPSGNNGKGCTLFIETVALQDFAIRLGMNPVAVSPFYEVK